MGQASQGDSSACYDTGSRRCGHSGESSCLPYLARHRVKGFAVSLRKRWEYGGLDPGQMSTTSAVSLVLRRMDTKQTNGDTKKTQAGCPAADTVLVMSIPGLLTEGEQSSKQKHIRVHCSSKSNQFSQ